MKYHTERGLPDEENGSLIGKFGSCRSPPPFSDQLGIHLFILNDITRSMMKPSELNRRDFNKLAAAAFGGVVAGTTLGCSKKSSDKSGSKSGSNVSTDKKSGDGSGSNVAVAEKHVCKGLNTCKGKGADGKNKCKGQGTCATVAHHECAGKNDCRGQGGCGETAGKNECKGKGGCKVPLMKEKLAELKAAFDKKHGIK